MMKTKSKWGVAVIAGVLIAGGGFAAVNAATAQTEPVAVVVTDQPTQEPIIVPTSDPVTVQPAPVVEPAPAPVVEPAPAEPAPEPYVEPQADPAPWVPSSDPENANGGDWDLSSCPNGASTGADGQPHCD